MIIEEYKEILITSSGQISYYRKLGYNPIKNEYLKVQNKDLPQKSQTIIEERICDLCNKEYSKNRKGHFQTFARFDMDVCPTCVRNNDLIQKITKDRREQTMQIRYGVSNCSQAEEVKKKKQDTCVNHPSLNANAF